MADEVIQAVLLADWLDRELTAVSDPAALLPLVGVPLLDYSLETLAISGVNETFVFCSSHSEQIKHHIHNAQKEKVPWSLMMTVHTIVSETCRSPGDAMRDLDAKGLVRGYFILSSVDSISNVRLVPLLEKHKEICKKDKNATMLLIYKNAVPGHRAQSIDDNILLAARTYNNRVLQYQKLNKVSQEKVTFPIEIFLHNSEVTLHSDLIDTGIAMCSPSVLPLFADNFDFQTVDDFIKGILMNEELLASTIYYHQLQGDQYASKISNLKMYQTISQDIMHRWVYPLVPDMGISKQQQTYILLRNYVYRHNNITLARNCKLEEDVLISQGSSIGEKSIVKRSVIGKNCEIGAGCEIEDSYLMDGCVVSNNSIIKASVLGVGCKIRCGTVTNVICGPNVELKSPTEDCYVQATKSGISSQKSIDRKMDDLTLDEPKGPSMVVYNKWCKEETYDECVSSDDDVGSIPESIQEDENLFLQEVIDSLVRGYEEKLNCDNLILEINSSRYAYNMSLPEVNFNVIKAIFSLDEMKTTVKEVVPTFKRLYGYFKPVIVNYIKDPDAMIECLHAMEDICKDNDVINKCIGKILVILYDQDVLSEDVIMDWHSNLDTDDSFAGNASLTSFIKWLEEADEESD